MKTPMCRKLSRSSDMQNDDLMHREGLRGWPFEYGSRDSSGVQSPHNIEPL